MSHIRNIIHKSRVIYKIPMATLRRLGHRMSPGDGYPSVFTDTGFKALTYITNCTRLMFWNSIASRSKTLQHLYRPDVSVLNISVNGIQSMVLQKTLSASVKQLAINAAKYGVGYMPNFLDLDQLEAVIHEFEDISTGSPDHTLFGSGVDSYNTLASPRVTNYFRSAIAFLTLELLGVQCGLRNVGLQRLVLNGVKDELDPNTILHIDRFLPCIKIFFFPHAISDEDSPFGYIPYSHIISRKYKDNVIKTFHERSYKPSLEPWSFSIENPTPNRELKLTVPPNSLVVAYTNGMHRRIPFSLSPHLGGRDSLRFNFYNQFTRKSLLMLSRPKEALIKTT